GNFVVVAAQAGVAGHLKIGDQAVIAGQSGVMNEIPAGEKWLGSPACRDINAKRQYIALRRLPDLLHRVAELEKKLAEMSSAGS
ncbi:MAG TPA: hypothetical protein VK530_04235, partial [Candidatus Acidoferrum sp.]|nr:hypothetical protein [Candidatus Acidoferrum sp.]